MRQRRPRGYDPIYGARPLKRVIQQRTENMLATELLKGDVKEGETVKIDYQQEEFVFQVVDKQPSEIKTESVS